MTHIPEVFDPDHQRIQSHRLLLEWEGFFSSNPAMPSEYPEASVNLQSVVLLELYDQSCSRWILVRPLEPRSRGNKWQFPSATFVPGELPLTAALRAVSERLVLETGPNTTRDALEPAVCGVGVDWLPTLIVTMGATQPLEVQNTLVFTYHARHQVADVSTVKLVDKGRPDSPVKMVDISDLQALILDESLCPASHRLWTNYWAMVPGSD